MALELDIGANTRKFMAGTKDVEAGLEDVMGTLDELAASTDRSADRAADGLSDAFQEGAREAERSVDKIDDAVSDMSREVAREADKAGDKIADGIDDGTDRAGKELVKFERKFADLQQAAARESTKVGDDLGDNVKRGTKDAEAGLDEFRDEANSTAKESAASFDGSAESIVDSFQEIAANAFAGFGPAGAIAGLALAAGIGIGVKGFQDNQEASEELKQTIADLTGQYVEAGSVGKRSMSDVSDAVRAMAEATDDGGTSLQDLHDLAERTHQPFERIALAIAGDTNAISELQDATNKSIEALEKQSEANDDGAGGFARAATGAEKQRDALLDLRGRLDEASEAQKTAAENAKLFAEADDGLTRKAEAAQTYSEAIQDAYADAGAEIQEYVEDGVVNLDKYNESARAHAEAITNYQANMVTASQTLSQEALNYIASLGPEAAPLLDAFVKAPLAKKQETAAVWTTLGSTSSNAFGTKLQSDLNASNYHGSVVLDPDMSRVIAELNKKRVLNIEARVQNNIASQLPPGQGMGVP